MSYSRGWKIVGAAALAAIIALPAAAGISETVSFDGDRLQVRSLIGSVQVESHSGSSFEVVVESRGKDAREGLIELEQDGDELRIVFPDEREFVYPELRGSTTIGNDGGSWLSRIFGSDRIRVRGSGSGMELWTDVTVRVPDGAELALEHAVGDVRADGVDARLELSTRSGNVTVADTRGDLSVATGSGDIAFTAIEGRELRMATGSGDVEGERSHGDSLEIATGSGEVTLEDIRGDSLEVATGSGDVKVGRSGLDSVEVGTGSGDVELALDRMGGGNISVGTGSGDIVLRMPGGTACDVHAETDGGRVDVQVSGADFSTKEADEVRFTVGGGGSRVRLGSGNGDIRIRG